MDIDEAPVLKEAVDGVGGHRPHPEGGGEQVGPGPQMLDGAQELHAVALFLQGIVGGGGALHRDGGGFHLQRLLGLGGKRHRPLNGEGGPHVLPGDLLVIVQNVGVHDDLKVLKAGAIVELNKPEGLHVPDGSGPAHNGDGLAIQAFLVGKNGGNGGAFHIILSISCKIVVLPGLSGQDFFIIMPFAPLGKWLRTCLF